MGIFLRSAAAAWTINVVASLATGSTVFGLTAGAVAMFGTLCIVGVIEHFESEQQRRLARITRHCRLHGAR